MDVQIPCVCEGSPHDIDTVTLRDRLDFRSVTAIRHGISFLERNEDGEHDPAEILAVLTEGYVVYGIESWSVVGTDGQPMPTSHTAIRDLLLSNLSAAQDVGDAADDMYGEKVLLPLLARASNSSRATPTEASTSAAMDSPTRLRKPSKPSSTTSSRTVGTGTTGTSPAGDSSSSPSSASAA